MIDLEKDIYFIMKKYNCQYIKDFSPSGKYIFLSKMSYFSRGGEKNIFLKSARIEITFGVPIYINN